MPRTPDPEGVPPTDGRSTRWAAHRRARRDELVDAALRAITRLGPDVAMDDIATEAGTSKTALYRHFADKAQLHHAVVARVDRRVVAVLRTAVLAAPGPRQALAAAITTYVHLVRDDPQVYRFVLAAPVQPRSAPPSRDPLAGLSGAIADELARLVAARLPPPPGGWAHEHQALTTAGPWAHGIVALVRAAADTWVSHSEAEADADALGASLTALVWDGLGSLVDLRPPPPRRQEQP